MAESSVVDFQMCRLDVKTPDKAPNHDVLKTLGTSIIEAIKAFGFCYLKNTGVNEDLIKDYMKVSRAFFEHPTEMKQEFSFDLDRCTGWLKLEGEICNPDRKTGDFKETFNYTPNPEKEVWPPVKDFDHLTKKFFDAGNELAFIVLDAVSLGLNIPTHLMRTNHSLVGKGNNLSQIRTLIYPPIPEGHCMKPDQVRLGEHIDFGTISRWCFRIL